VVIAESAVKVGAVMRYRLVFIGVDRYSDPQIRDLSGAVNDARALWSLFTDTQFADKYRMP
jgi:hypothetical protein